MLKICCFYRSKRSHGRQSVALVPNGTVCVNTVSLIDPVSLYTVHVHHHHCMLHVRSRPLNFIAVLGVQVHANVLFMHIQVHM